MKLFMHLNDVNSIYEHNQIYSYSIGVEISSAAFQSFPTLTKVWQTVIEFLGQMGAVTQLTTFASYFPIPDFRRIICHEETLNKLCTAF